jgi:hypothetical protein
MRLITIKAPTNSAGRKRAHQQIGDVARPHLFEKREGKSLLAAQPNIPQENPADQRARRYGGAIQGDALRLDEVGLQKAPGEHLHRRANRPSLVVAARTNAAVGIA